MSHFSKSALGSDPEALDRLRGILQGRSVGRRAGKAASTATNGGNAIRSVPTIEERFGVRTEDHEAVSCRLRLVSEDAALR